jgi:hypothetical protein
MKPIKDNNYAFIDSQNLNLAIRDLGWMLDFKKLEKLIIPNQHKFSSLLRKFASDMVFMNDLEGKLGYK